MVVAAWARVGKMAQLGEGGGACARRVAGCVRWCEDGCVGKMTRVDQRQGGLLVDSAMGTGWQC